MSKINHSRPHLRFIDNLRRELAREASEISLPSDHAQGQQHRGTSNAVSGMPRLGPGAAKIAISLLDLLARYYDNQSQLIKSISPEATKSERRKATILRSEKDALEKQIFEEAIKLLKEAFRKQAAGDSSIAEWVDWLEAKAISTNSYALLDLFEVGFKPAFEALNKVVSQKVAGR